MFRTIGVGANQRPQTDSHSRRGRLGAIGLSTFLVAGLVATVSPASPVSADPGDYKLDFTAAAPATYNHKPLPGNPAGGGAFNDRTVGVSADIVESLEGGQFECLDIVTYLTQIRRDGTWGTTGKTETIALDYSFLADTTGQSGVAMTDITLVTVNSANVENGGGGDGIGGGIGVFASDDGHDDFQGNSSATLVNEQLSGPAFQKGSLLTGTAIVTGIDPGDRIVVRVDVLLSCDSPRPTGNLQAALVGSRVTETYPGGQTGTIRAGEQTVPFKQVGGIYPVACPEQDFVWDGQDPSCNEGLPEAAGQSTSLFSDESSETSSGVPVISDVRKLVGANREVSSMFAFGAVIGLVALRRRSPLTRRTSS